jgi:hypothetical protein
LLRAVVLLGPASAQDQRKIACATEAQRKIKIEKLNEDIDGFLAFIEEVPEDVARQLRDANASDAALAHPLRQALRIRELGALIKTQLSPWSHETRKDRLKRAISALANSASFSVLLSEYTNKTTIKFLHNHLPGSIEVYVLCLVDDLVASGTGSGTTTAR